MQAQRRNRFSFRVTWPEGKAPPGCPDSYLVWYPTLEAAELAARGFRMLGASV